jgi:GT2 family glycosyltransferase
MNPRVSVVCVTWNSQKHIERCLAALHAQTYENFEIILVDNNSRDGSPESVAERFPQIHLIRNKANVGFCRATNQGIRASQGEFILVLNPDVFPEPTFLEELLSYLSQNIRHGSVGGKLLLINRGKRPHLIDSAGLMLGRCFRARDRGNLEEDRGQYEREESVFALCGAAVMFRKEALERIKVADEYFDEDFFAYYDDLDVGWRIQLSGYESGYAPRAVAYHQRGGSGMGVKFFHKIPSMQRFTLRNRYFMLIKNLSVANVLYFLPYLILTEILIFFYIVTRAPHLLTVYVDVWRHLPKFARKRTAIQKARTRDNRYIRSWVKHAPL